MTIEDNRNLIQQYFSVITGVDTSTELSEFFTEDVTWHLPQSNPMIKPNPRVGLDAVMDILTSGVNVYQAGSLKIRQPLLVADTDHVTAQFTLDAKLANGKDYSNQYVMLFSILEGKINRVWEHLDTLYQWQLGTFDGHCDEAVTQA
ncbi:MAG: nuclear transport factor 2 family protein [Halioglobus sp.]